MNTIPAPSTTDRMLLRAHRATWEGRLISILVAAVQARDARIKHLEQLNHQLAVALDSERGAQTRRRAA